MDYTLYQGHIVIKLFEYGILHRTMYAHRGRQGNMPRNLQMGRILLQEKMVEEQSCGIQVHYTISYVLGLVVDHLLQQTSVLNK